ncbi:hemolysin III family protein [Acinetobacter haemolyticus]|uniref:Hemolysin III family protein n=2 Tax=Acinetobacter haemolyticus TaxID=29430 RepID=A0AAW4J7D2_ACIHA|nr:hemolysin III family protein [Acinetobacter haemolyticus]EPR89999.1 putative membrane protein hemolysin III [Acinetobacter haemolyticus CIP 64.3 = MTCC 9819]MBO3658806.1 hemolysin III family protein [Acinetobacter haemolyticus]MCU4387548.1 hemolysin III family protein [Acinetobacter haemolyticus]NAS03948.1 hemolysin III family protein [Acinetobacter haemolyticus]NAS04775.1 hemolysin III family protein [Acinetobacter haemolyticus]
MNMNSILNYDPKEERLNAYSHGIGAILALIASVFLIIKGSYLPLGQWISLWVYGFSLVLLLSSSMLYHFAQDETRRYWYKKLDHTAIYYLIAGTYTPFLSIAIPTAKAHYLLIALWVIAFIGTLFKLVFIHRFQKLSLVAYLVMGWLAVLLMDDMQRYLSKDALQLLIAGGLAYTIGTLFYALKKVRYTHAIWHIFVLLGAGLHFLAIYWYVL